MDNIKIGHITILNKKNQEDIIGDQGHTTSKSDREMAPHVSVEQYHLDNRFAMNNTGLMTPQKKLFYFDNSK